MFVRNVKAIFYPLLLEKSGISMGVWIRILMVLNIDRVYIPKDLQNSFYLSFHLKNFKLVWEKDGTNHLFINDGKKIVLPVTCMLINSFASKTRTNEERRLIFIPSDFYFNELYSDGHYIFEPIPCESIIQSLGLMNSCSLIFE